MFQIGNKLGTGRPVGSKTLKTRQWEEFANWFMHAGMRKFQVELDKLEGVQYVNKVLQLMEYFRPKLSRKEITGEDGEPILIYTNEQAKKILTLQEEEDQFINGEVINESEDASKSEGNN